MKKFGLLLIALIGYSSTFYAQQGWCGTDAQLQKTFAANPELINEFIEHNIRISTGQIQGADRSDPIIIPVVFLPLVEYFSLVRVDPPFTCSHRSPGG